MRLPILDKLEQEMMEAQKELSIDIPRALKIATDMGDLSENAEYKAAKERQSFLQSRISQLQKRVSDINSVNINMIPKDRSGLGSTLWLKDLSSGEETQFHLVFPEEVDPEKGKISTASPVGRAIMGKQEGDEITIPLPDKTREYEIVRIATIHEVQKEKAS